MIRLLKNRLVAASLLFLLLNLAGGFLIMAPLLVLLRNHLDHSAEALTLWPVMNALTLTDIFINDTQMIATFVISAIVIFFLFMLLRTFLTGGIYGIIILDKEPFASSAKGPLRDFLAASAEVWPGFIKVALLSILFYLVAAFIGGLVSRLLSFLGIFMQIVVFLFFVLIASTYIQVLKARIVSTSNSSISEAIRSTRPDMRRSAARLIAGNLSVVIAGAIAAWILWSILASIRGHGWNLGLAVITIVLEQGIVFVICLMQVIRINYNYSIIRRGTQDVVGGTKLGGV